VGDRLREMNRILRRPLRRRLDQLVASPRLPFEVRSRLHWRQQQQRWVARRPASSFADKVRWKMLKDRRPLLTTFADKVAVRDYVARVVGPEVLTECYAIASDPDEIDRASLPREFVAKSSHACGGVWIVADFAPEDGAVFPGSRPLAKSSQALEEWCWVFVRPDRLDWGLLTASFRRWLAINFGAHFVEWAYSGIRPRILVEELLKGPEGRPPDEHKLSVIHGRVELIGSTRGLLEDDRNFYLADWTPLDLEKDVYPRGDPRPAPRSLGRMLDVAEALGQETDFVRVDLYETPDRVVFGELTNYPEGGVKNFAPLSFDDELGRLWTLPRRYA
jgi:hypothetical protein